MLFTYLILAGMGCMAGLFALAFTFAIVLMIIAATTKAGRIDAAFLENIQKEYGMFASYSQWRPSSLTEKITYQSYIVERDGTNLFVIKRHVKPFVGYSTSYILFDLKALRALKIRLEDASRLLNGEIDPAELPRAGIADTIFMGNALQVWQNICIADDVRGFLNLKVPSNISLAVLRRFPAIVASNRSRNGERIQESPHVVIKRDMRKGPLFSIDYFYFDSGGILSLLKILEDALRFLPASRE